MVSFLKSVFSRRNLLIFISVSAILSLLLAYLSPYVHPDTLFLIPLFGLGYPIIILYTLFALTIAIISKSRWSFAIVATILIGFNLHFRTIAFGSGDEPTENKEIKIMSYNVHLFDRYNPILGECYKTKNEIFKFLSNADAGIYCFQEFYQQDAPTSFATRDSLIEILGIKDYHQRFKQTKWGRQNFGVCTMSKYPMIEKGDIIFENVASSNNYCIYSDVVIENDTIRIYNVHLQSIHFQKDDYALFATEDSQANNISSTPSKLINKVLAAYPIRVSQSKLILEHIEQSPYPAIVCGDFNDTPLSYTYNLFNSQLKDAFRNSSSGIGSTYAGKIPAGRIDYIFHDEIFGSNSFIIQSKKLSDHYAIQCNIFLKNQ